MRASISVSTWLVEPAPALAYVIDPGFALAAARMSCRLVKLLCADVTSIIGLSMMIDTGMKSLNTS
jgi:hypothetical protein